VIGIIAAKEARALLRSPLAWVLLAVLQLILGWIFLGRLDAYLHLQPQLAHLANPPGFTEVVVAPLAGSAVVLLLMVAPMLTMRLIAEERRNQTLTFLISAPVSVTQIVLGKFLGLMAFLLLPVLLVAAMGASLAAGGALDFGLLAANLLGLALLAACFAAVGLYFSSLTSHPALAAIGGLGMLLGLWVLDANVAEAGSPLRALSLLRRFEGFNMGVVDSYDLAYLLLFVTLFLALAVQRLDAERWGG
jgi:ABC-2 type transport system permease protein